MKSDRIRAKCIPLYCLGVSGTAFVSTGSDLQRITHS